MNEAEMRQKYMELQMAAQQVGQLQSQLEALQAKSQELMKNIENVAEMKERGSAEMLVPIVDGIFAKARTEDTGQVYVNVGAGVAVKKTIEQAGEMLKEKEAEMQRYRKEVLEELEKKSEEARMIEQSFEHLMARQKNV